MGASKIKYSPDTYVESMVFELEIIDPMLPGVSGGVRLYQKEVAGGIASEGRSLCLLMLSLSELSLKGK